MGVNIVGFPSNCPSAANVNISTRASDSRCRCRKRNYAMPIKRLLNAVERRGDIGRRVAALVPPISNRPRVTSRCAGKIGLRESGEHTSGPNLASRDNVAHNQNSYTILETPPPATLLRAGEKGDELAVVSCLKSLPTPCSRSPALSAPHGGIGRSLAQI